MKRDRRPVARRAARTGGAAPFVVVTGLSGAGKSQAIRALEDLGYFCVDNLPVALMPTLAELTLRAGRDLAGRGRRRRPRRKELAEFPGVYRKLKAMRNRTRC